MQNSTRIRVGAVNYLNTKPLVYGLEKAADRIDLSFDLPSRLADQLAVGQLDVALIPSIEMFQDPAYTVVSNACIACRGPVLSVKLFSRVPVAEIHRLALDEGSRTSIALVRILLQQRFGVTPQLEPLPIGEGVDSTQADAVLLIGDRAIDPLPSHFEAIWDLGEEWCRWAELPFVFAMWTARPSVELGDLDTLLSQSRDEGLTHLAEIAEREAPLLGLTPSRCLSYLKDNLYFFTGEREWRGLELFYEHASALGLAPTGLELAGNAPL